MEKLKLKAVGYRRVSMREQVDGYSLDAQEKNIRDYAASQGWDLIEIYMDAKYMARCGNQVLLIDLDPHWQCATSLGMDRRTSPQKIW